MCFIALTGARKGWDFLLRCLWHYSRSQTREPLGIVRTLECLDQVCTALTHCVHRERLLGTYTSDTYRPWKFEVKIPTFPPCAAVLRTSQDVPYAHLGSCFTSSYNFVSSALYRLGYPWIAHVLIALNMLHGKYIHDLSPDILVTPHSQYRTKLLQVTPDQSFTHR